MRYREPPEHLPIDELGFDLPIQDFYRSLIFPLQLIKSVKHCPEIVEK